MTDQKWMVAAMDSLLQDCPDDISVLANACAFLFSEMEEVNWLGFYRVHQNQLYLGPFQGLPACTTI
ncbi:MAG: GAF domain-containing protein, partial [Bacilli bacterium]|nr:GAF domain-containing protein [Bacilli bacterium]